MSETCPLPKAGEWMTCLRTAPLLVALPQSLEIGPLKRAFRVTTEALLRETDQVDPELAKILAEPLRELAEGPNES